jgi:signal transduction histidine kinase
VALVYIVSAVLLPLDLISLWDYSFYLSDGWQLVISMYQASVLLACVGLLVRTYVTTWDPKIRAQLKIITLCSGVGLVVPALLVVPMVMLDLDVNDILKSVAVFAALAVPAGYAYSMLRYNLLIEGVLYRPRLVRVIYTSVFSLGLVAFIVFSWPSDGSARGGGALTGSSVLAAWAGIALVVVALAAIQEWLGQWMETHLLKGGTYVDLLASATNDLQRFHDLQEYVRFFTETLLARLKSIGSLVFLTEGADGSLTLQGHSPSLRLPLPKEGMPAIPLDSELRGMMQSANGPVSLSTLLMPHSPPFSASDTHLLEVFTILRVEWLLPLVSGQRPRPQLIGLVALGAKETDETYSAQELTALAALARTASIAAENVLMFDALEKRVVELDQEREFSAALTRDVSAAQEKERTRISSEIHDTVLQELAVGLRLLARLRDSLQQALGRLEDSEIALERLGDLTNADLQNSVGVSARRQIQSILNECQSTLATLLGEGTLDDQGLGLIVEDVDVPNSRSDLLAGPLDDIDGKHLVDDILSLVRSTNDRLREICTDLHPAYLDAPLAKTLSRSMHRLGRVYPSVHMEIRVNGLEPATLGDTIKDVCKKITDQAIHNALNHAQASSIEVEMTFTNTIAGSNGAHAGANLMLSIVDDGVGFAPRTPGYWRSTRHHGLANMYESSALIGGHLQIDSTPRRGTRVNLRVSLDASSSH